MTSTKKILNRFYLIVALLLVFVLAVSFKLLRIQVVHGEEYEEISHAQAFKTFTIPANRGNLYDTNGNLLATSVPNYTIRFDSKIDSLYFYQNVDALAKGLSDLMGNTKQYHLNRLHKARNTKNRYFLIAKNVPYSEYLKFRELPIFSRGAIGGGFIAEQEMVRELPLGKIAERTVGKGKSGLEGAYNEFLEGKDGQRLKQKLAKGQWKPVSDANEIDPKDGLDVISTIDVNIQDIVHHALLKQLEHFEADHGTAIVMEVKTGEIKGMANLGRTDDGKYYEKRNYGIWEAQEPGSTFKLVTLVAALEDKVVDTSMVFDTEGGRVRYYDRTVRDVGHGNLGEITAAEALVVSSNTVFSKIAFEGYKKNPKAFYNRLDNMGLVQPIGLDIMGEGAPKIPHPGDKNWYGTTLPWMSFGYGVALTPLQILTFYNAIANNGVRVKPKLIREIRDRDRIVKKFDQPIVTNSICSHETAAIARQLLRDAVEKKNGTGRSIRSASLPLAGKTGTTELNYANRSEKQYIASFAGFFPADEPKYSCIVVISKPNYRIGRFGGDVAAPAFKEIAEKLHTRTPQPETWKTKKFENEEVINNYQNYYTLAQDENQLMPNLIGMPAMDAVSLLENMGLKANLTGIGTVSQQSVKAGTSTNNQSLINLTAN